MNISIVIPNYNGQELLEKNLPQVIDAVKGYKKGKVEIIVADDGSTDDSVTVLKQFVSRYTIPIKVIKHHKNLGFSSNVNNGVHSANGEIVILLNTDVIPEKGFIDPLLTHFSHEQVFAVGCMDKSVENDSIVLRGRGVGKWHHGFLVHRAGSLNKQNTLWASGGSSAFRKSLWEKLGGMDDLFNPFYWEDIDLSYRALKAGYDVFFEPKSVVRHEHETGTIKTTFKESHITSVAYRNQFFFVWKNVTDLSLILSHILWLPYHLLKAIVRRDTMLIKGFFQALSFYGAIMGKRHKTQKQVKRSDKDVIKSLH